MAARTEQNDLDPEPSESKEPWDYLEIVKTIKGEDAYRPVSESKCPLLKK